MKRDMKDVEIGSGVWYEKAYNEGVVQHQTQQKMLRHQEERTIE